MIQLNVSLFNFNNIILLYFNLIVYYVASGEKCSLLLYINNSDYKNKLKC